MSRWTSWAPVPNKPTVSVDVKQPSTTTLTCDVEFHKNEVSGDTKNQCRPARLKRSVSCKTSAGLGSRKKKAAGVLRPVNQEGYIRARWTKDTTDTFAPKRS